jgi:hypothetical protein
MTNVIRGVLVSALLLVAVDTAAQEQQFAMFGDFSLESGEVLGDCRVGYRTFGTLNPDRSNVIRFPTWAGGTTEQLSGNIGPGKLADSSVHYVILDDAFSAAEGNFRAGEGWSRAQFRRAGGSSVLIPPVQVSRDSLRVGAAKQLFQMEGAGGI